MRKLDHVKGFTLIELLIVLVIMSLLLSLVPPLLSNVMPSVSVKASANDLYHDIKYVRNIAVLSGRQTSMVLNARTSSYASEFKDNGKIVTLPQGVTVSLSGMDALEENDDENVLRFFADGSSSGGLVELRTEEKRFVILIDWLTGKVTLDESGYDDNA